MYRQLMTSCSSLATRSIGAREEGHAMTEPSPSSHEPRSTTRVMLCLVPPERAAACSRATRTTSQQRTPIREMRPGPSNLVRVRVSAVRVLGLTLTLGLGLTLGQGLTVTVTVTVTLTLSLVLPLT